MYRDLLFVVTKHEIEGGTVRNATGRASWMQPNWKANAFARLSQWTWKAACKAWGGLQIRLAHCNSAGLESCHVAHCFSWKLCRLRFMGIHFALYIPHHYKTWTWPGKCQQKHFRNSWGGTVQSYWMYLNVVNSRRCWLVNFTAAIGRKTFANSVFHRRGARCVLLQLWRWECGLS